MISNTQLLIKTEDIVRLDSNEFPFIHAPIIIDNKICLFSSYPDDNCTELRIKLAELNQIHPDNILVTAGSSQAILLIILGLLPGSEIIVSAHSFQLYQECATNQTKKVIVVNETEQWDQDLLSILEAITNSTRLIFITNPSNPLGTWINNHDLEKFLNTIPKNIIVVIDEAYFEFMTDEPLYNSSISFINRYQNIIVLRTFSKAYGLAGCRVGYAITNSDIIKNLKQNKLPFSVSTLSIYYALKALECITYYKNCANEIIITRRFLYYQLKRMGFKPLANSANFITFKFGAKCQIFVEVLKQKKILVRSLEHYNLSQYIRVSIGTKNEIILFLNYLVKFFEENNINKVTLPYNSPSQSKSFLVNYPPGDFKNEKEKI